MGSAKLKFCEFTVSPKMTSYDKSGTSWKTQYQSIKIYNSDIVKVSQNSCQIFKECPSLEINVNGRFHRVSIPFGKTSYHLEDM